MFLPPPQEKISVIVPVYNDPIYIERCLDSLINQTYSNLEIIVVDDGSTDDTNATLQEYSKKDSRIIVITQQNQKQGAARNNGFKHSTGSYITFVDSDDWLDTDYCEKLFKAIHNTDIDFALSEAVRIKPNGKTRKYINFDKEELAFGFENILKVNQVPSSWSVWGRLYKRELIQNILFEEGVFYEDPEYLIKVLHKTKKCITVPGVKYYYFSNNKSTIKSNHSISKRLDQINSMLKVIKYAKNNNLILPEILITAKRHLLYTIKYYENYKDIYIFGKKVKRTFEKYYVPKNILVFNTACFGDVLLCNSLVQNIRKVFPDSNIIFVVNKPFVDVAKYQKDVDEVIIFDKKDKHKGILGILKFIKEFKYKNDIFASFITYKNMRNFLIAKLIKSKFIINPFEFEKNEKVQIRHNKMLQVLTNKKIVNYPIAFEIPENIKNTTKNKFDLPEKYITLCTISKNPLKDMPLDTAINIIKNLKGYKVVLVGAGELSKKYAMDLRNANCDFIDLIDKTTIPELADVINSSYALISVDTGTMHLGCALQKETVAVFYEKISIKNWAPDSNLYNSYLINENQTAENILNVAMKIINKEFDV